MQNFNVIKKVKFQDPDRVVMHHLKARSTSTIFYTENPLLAVLIPRYQVLKLVPLV